MDKVRTVHLKPHRINNYTHLITLLKLKQSKYKNFTHSPTDHSFSKILANSARSFNLDSVIDGFLHQKLKEECENFENQLFADFNKAISSKIKEIKTENNQKVCVSKIGNLKDIEQLFVLRPTQLTFKDDLLFEM